MTKTISILSFDESSDQDRVVETLVNDIETRGDEFSRGVDETLEDIRSICAIDEIATNMDSAPTGVETASGQAIAVAVEHMLKRVKSTKKIAFEEYATVRSKKQQTTIAVEALRENISAIWKKILAAIRAAINWLKNLFTKQTVVDGLNEKKAREFDEKFKAAKAQNKDSTDKKMTLAVVARRLNVGGKAFKAKEVLHLFDAHSKLVSNIYTASDKSEGTAMQAVEHCIADLESGSDTFQKNLNEGIVACFDIPEGFTRSKDQHKFGEISTSTEVYECELVFGQRSVFKTGSHAPNKSPIEDVHYELAASSTAREFDPASLEFESLDMRTLDALSAKLKHHNTEIQRVARNRRNGHIQYLTNLEKKLNYLINHQTDTIRKDTGRITQISKLIARAQAILAADNLHLVSYDSEVYSTFLTYTLACVMPD